MKTVNFSETIAACDLKVGRSRHLIEYIVTLAQKVNNSILHTFQEKQKTSYLFLLSSHANVISCFQMGFLTVFKCGKSSSYSFIIM